MNKLLILLQILIIVVILSSCGNVYYCHSKDGRWKILKLDTLIGGIIFDSRNIKPKNLIKICDIVREDIKK